MSMAATPRAWTLDDLYALPDDGNKHELVRGELFVTPAPSYGHEAILAHLTHILDPYVTANGLGLVLRARAALRHEGSEVEPDLMVRRRNSRNENWETAPAPSLVVEVLSPTTRRRDREQKRAFYLDAGVGEYWVIDPDARTITAARHGALDSLHRDSMTWQPAGAPAPLAFDIGAVFEL